MDFSDNQQATTALEMARPCASAVGFAFHNLEEVLAEAKCSAEVTHNHPEGIKGAQAVACAIFLARKVKTKIPLKVLLQIDLDMT